MPPSPPLNGIKMVALVHDLIPLIFSEHYFKGWPGPEYARLYLRGLDRLRRYDGFVTNSGGDPRRRDRPPRRPRPTASPTSAPAATAAFFTPDPSDATDLEPLGIRGPFVFSVGSIEYRKNVNGLIDAFAGLPESVRSTHQLVLTLQPERRRGGAGPRPRQPSGRARPGRARGPGRRPDAPDALSPVRGVRLPVGLRGVRLPGAGGDALRGADDRGE